MMLLCHRVIRLSHPVLRPAYSSQGAHQLFEEIPPQRTLCSVLSSPIAFSKCIALHLSSPPAIFQLHALSVTSGLFSRIPVSNSLINAYSKLGYSSTALELFQIAPNRNTASWNTIISRFSCVVRGMKFVLQMLRGGYSLDASTIGTILSFSSNSSDFLPGFQIHSLAAKLGHVSDTVVGNALIIFYSRSGSIEDACKMFDEMLVRDTVSWNALIHGFAHESDNGSEVIPLFLRMLKEDHVRPDKTTVGTIVPFCDSGKLGTQIHCLSSKIGIDRDLCVSNALISMYYRSGALDYARNVFAGMKLRDVVSWTSMISIDPNNAICLFNGMRKDNITPNDVTFVALIFAIPNNYSVCAAGMVHSMCYKSGHISGTVVANALITLYSRSGPIEDAYKIFDEMLVRGTVTWNELIYGFARRSDNGSEVIPLFLRMLKEDRVRPDVTTVATIVPFCGSGKLGTQIHCLSSKIGIDRNLAVSTALMSMYYRSGALDYARNLFSGMKLRDSVSWNCMMSIDPDNAVCLFNGMRKDKVTPDDLTFVALIYAIPSNYSVCEAGMVHTMCYKLGLSIKVNVSSSLITMYARLGSTGCAKKVFDEMPVRDIISWNALVSGYLKNGLYEETLQIFSSLVSHLKPNHNTFGIVLCSISTGKVTSLVFGRMCHCYIHKLGLNTNDIVSTALIDMYAKQGSLEDSVKAFNENSERSVVSWTAIISAHSKHGYYDRALDLFENMVNSKIAPNGRTLLVVLMACGLKGDVIAGKKIFDSIYNVYKLEPWPAHYTTMVDMLGKVGKLEEAENLVKSMPGGPCTAGLQSLLYACKVHGDTELGDWVADLVLKTDPSDSESYVSVSVFYADRGEWEVAARVRKEMNEKGVKKERAFSWVDVGLVSTLGMYKFSPCDTAHPMAKDIYEIVESLGLQMKSL